MSDTDVCFLHPSTAACAICAGCGKAVCAVCLRRLNTVPFCEACAANHHEQSPVAACIFGLLVPGMGQAYNREWKKGALVYLTGWLVVPWIWGIVDACRGAEAIRTGEVSTAGVWPGYVVLAVKLLTPVLMAGYAALVMVLVTAVRWLLT